MREANLHVEAEQGGRILKTQTRFGQDIQGDRIVELFDVPINRDRGVAYSTRRLVEHVCVECASKRAAPTNGCVPVLGFLVAPALKNPSP